MSIAVSTSGRLYPDFIRLLFRHAHREASALDNELPEDSDQFRFIRAACFVNLQSSIGLTLAKSSALHVSIPIDFSSRPFLPPVTLPPLPPPLAPPTLSVPCPRPSPSASPSTFIRPHSFTTTSPLAFAFFFIQLQRKSKNKIRHYHHLYANRPDPIVVLPFSVSTSGRLDFRRFLLLLAHREASALTGKLETG